MFLIGLHKSFMGRKPYRILLEIIIPICKLKLCIILFFFFFLSNNFHLLCCSYNKNLPTGFPLNSSKEACEEHSIFNSLLDHCGLRILLISFPFITVLLDLFAARCLVYKMSKRGL